VLDADGLDLIVPRAVDWWSVLTFEGRVGDAAELALPDPPVPDDAWSRGYQLVRRAMPFAYAGQSDTALEYSDRALAIAEEIGNPSLYGWSHYVRGESLMGTDPAAAIEAYTEATRYADSVGNTFLAGLLSVARASALGRHGKPVETLEQFQATIIRWRDTGAWSFLSTTLRNFGEYLVRLERYEDAAVVRCGVEGQLDSSSAGGVDADRDRFLRQQVIDRLGRARFEELREQAHRMTRDEVVDAALGILDAELRARSSTSEFRVIVFTDLEESTAFMADRKDRGARDQLREYDLLTNKVIDRHDGQRVKGTGDGVLATFRSVGDALSCAVDLLREVDAAVDAGALPLRLRIGIHAGETIWDMDDVHGTVVNLAARVVDRAQGGEILATETVRQIALGVDHEFTPLGEADLKGIPEPVVLHRLEWRSRNE
jgi:class 3 adenylate cyclase